MKSVVHRIPISTAWVNLAQIVRRAYINREYFILEKHGIPLVGVMNIDEFEDYLDQQNPGLKKQIRRSQEQYPRGKARDAGKLLRELLRPAAQSKK